MSSSLQKEWQAFLNKLKKDKNPLYELLKDSGLDEDSNNALKLRLPTDEKKKEVKAKLPKIQAKMPLHWHKKRINVDVGEVPQEQTQTQTQQKRRVINLTPQVNSLSSMSRQTNPQSPLQSLNFADFELDKKGNELAQPVLKAAELADKTCGTIYKYLTEKTQKLAGENAIRVKFSWRVRVGGMRGFRELLLPVFHPVYGVPYVPSSSLKGAIIAAAIQLKLDTKEEINRILGTLDSGIACVQILDAFPTAPCLSVDMANPQWHWQENQVKYNPEPHALLSMSEPELLIGLIPTSRIANRNDAQNDVNKVRSWLEKALNIGIGSRVSGGYGRTNFSNNLPHSSSHNFQLWTQGMYGADTQQAEFRPVALRGMLRYWFRSFALGIYPPSECKELEATLFGTIEPKSKSGTLRIAVELEKDEKSNLAYFYKGKILLEAKSAEHLTLIEKILQLSSHLAGIGRGSRRPLHWNHPRMRGCHLQLSDFVLPGDKTDWKDFIKQVSDAFLVVQPPQGTPVLINPDNPRSQDILNTNAQIYLITNRDLKHPQDVRDWEKEGNTPAVRGKGLELLYSNPKFKGVSRDNLGNPQVGGKLGIPSFVLIKSNFPNSKQHYQTVTIFGSDNPQRRNFINALQAGYIRVW
ncbi:RAMP superfamily CRISPR-associated protein [Tolypothrix sp. VBCCA 56010]|uniref:RAMP superfamily CRISPR-associated protein n=1 Tax=Tolypothrix sp. VBCCA 56010 TaxID=3137731 RepID=UPI003D7EBCB2